MLVLACKIIFMKTYFYLMISTKILNELFKFRKIIDYLLHLLEFTLK